MVKSRRTFTREFKEEAVRLVENSDRKATEIARRLGIHPNLLDNRLRGVLADWLVASALNCSTGIRTEWEGVNMIKPGEI